MGADHQVTALGVHWWASHCGNGWLYLGFAKAVSLKGRSTSLTHAQAETHLAQHWSWEFSWILFLLKKKKWVQKEKKSELGLFSMGRCFVTRMFLRWGLSPSILASFLGLSRPLPRAADWRGGMGLPQVRYSKKLFKAAGSSPLLFTALPGGSCHRHAPTGASGTQQPSAPTQRHVGRVSKHLFGARGSCCLWDPAGKQEWTLNGLLPHLLFSFTPQRRRTKYRLPLPQWPQV